MIVQVKVLVVESLALITLLFVSTLNTIQIIGR